MPYSKEDLTGIGDALYQFIVGLQDGLGAEEMANLTSLVMEAADGVDEFKNSPKSAGIHVVARVADKFGDSLVADYE